MRVGRRSGFLLAALLLAACAGQDSPPPPPAVEKPADLVAPSLQTFGSGLAAQRWLADLDRLTGSSYTLLADIEAQAAAAGATDDMPEMHVIAAPSMAAPSVGTESEAETAAPVETTTTDDATSVTNTQVGGVDEGGVVKQVGRFLVVLQDGRLFVVDPQAGLRLVDRFNIYQTPLEEGWVDEILVEGNLVLATTYSYGLRATILSVLQVDPQTGQVSWQGRFVISSQDYFNTHDVATRLIDGALVVAVPSRLITLAPGLKPPTLQRVRLNKALDGQAEGREPAFVPVGPAVSLVEPATTYRPLTPPDQPMLVSVITCPLADMARQRQPACSVRGFVTNLGWTFFVSRTASYLIEYDQSGEIESDFLADTGSCERAAGRGQRGPLPSTVIRIPHRDGPLGMAHLYGQGTRTALGFEEQGGRFWALTEVNGSALCGGPASETRGTRSKLVSGLESVPLDGFAVRSDLAARPTLTLLSTNPLLSQRFRFAPDWLVYAGGATPSHSGRPAPQDGPVSQLHAVPLMQPEAATLVPLDMAVTRIQPMGAGVLAIGDDLRGLRIDYVSLRGTPELASSVTLPGLTESESRLGALNFVREPSGAYAIGLATTTREDPAAQLISRSEPSNLSFLRLSPQNLLASLGFVSPGPMVFPLGSYLGPDTRPGANGYACEMSCMDWYGNTRAVFIAGRTFALMGTQLVEADISGATVREVHRLDLTDPPQR